ncbi:MAG: hypothetical protein HOP33_23565 [Verrucomicrobia bacterium]|nr:hypothetical protein [Verrucomicrobiota bacterium]
MRIPETRELTNKWQAFGYRRSAEHRLGSFQIDAQLTEPGLGAPLACAARDVTPGEWGHGFPHEVPVNADALRLLE